MDPIAQAWVELKFENLYLKARGESFQELFSTLLEKRYPGDFVRVRPWGNVGDKKNDGHLPSARTIFQCYAPNELTAADAIKKINADFMGALAHWPDDFDRWIFVHNSKAGLGPDVLKALLDLQTDHPGKLVQSWGYEELLREVLFLEEGQLTSFLGAAPTRQAIVDLGMEDLVPVLDQIARHSVKPEIDVRRPARQADPQHAFDERRDAAPSGNGADAPRTPVFFCKARRSRSTGGPVSSGVRRATGGYVLARRDLPRVAALGDRGPHGDARAPGGVVCRSRVFL